MNLETELAEIPSRVDLGVKYLEIDRELADWRGELRESLDSDDKLFMNFCTLCVLGRLFGTYWNVVDVAGTDPEMLTDEQAQGLGFVGPMFDSASDGQTYYDALATEWLKRLNAREPA